MTHQEIMRIAMDEAEISASEGNAPFACVVISKDGKIIMREHDRVRELTDPTAHGEINAIRKLCQQRGTLSLDDVILYTTSEPCPSCMSGMIKAKVPAFFYGAKTEITASLPIPAEYIASKSQRNPIMVTVGY